MPDHQDARPLHTIGAAVIGTGFIGTVHVEALRRLGVTVHGILGSTPERGAQRAAQLGIPKAYRSLEELLDDPRVEVVHVASPNHLHHPQVRAVLAAGRHVVCEKPLALTSQETGELLALARQSGRVHAVNFNIRFYPLNQQVRALVADGELGTVHLVSGHYLQDWLLLETDWNWRLEPDRGGPLRAVADIGSHWLDLVSFLIGQPVEAVVADLATVVPVRQEPTGPVETFAAASGGTTRPRQIQTEDLATILLRFAGGVRGALVVSQVSPGRKNALRYEIDGSRAAACWESERPDELWIGHRQRANEILLRNPALMAPAAAATTSLPGGHAEGFADTFRALYRAVYSAVAAGGPPADPLYPTFADGHEEVLVGEAIAESARAGRWVAVRRETADAPGR
jgi:predicted dehydrogenase